MRHAEWQATADASTPRLTWVTNARSPGGWGDRMRGSLLAMRIAAANNRTLYLRWGGLHVLNSYLQPATFDWRPPKQSCAGPRGIKCDAGSGAEPVLGRGRVIKPRVKSAGGYDGAVAAALARAGDIELDTRRPAGMALPLSGAAPGSQQDLACAWAVLYAPTAALTARGEAQLAALNVTRPYAAVHLRLGGLEGERHALMRVAAAPRATSCPLTLARTATSCATALHAAETANSPALSSVSESVQHSAVLVVTDNQALRTELARGGVHGAIGPNYTAAHVALAAHARALAGKRWDAWVDVYLLANAAQLLTSHSGFSNMAAWWSHARTADVAACVRAKAGFQPKCARERKRGSG